jgi:hypothetical protein
VTVARFRLPHPPTSRNEAALAQQAAETITGTTGATVVLSNPPVPPLRVYVNGVLLPESTYTVVERTLTLPRALAVADVLTIVGPFRAQ